MQVRIAAILFAASLAAPGARAATTDELLVYDGPDREQILVDGARREGQVTLYSSMIVNQALRPLADAFSKKYPFVKMTYWRAESANIFTKLAAESRAGAPAADLVEGTGVGEVAVQAGLTQRYVSPVFKELPARYVDPKGMWAPTRRSYFSIAYNTKTTPEDRAPKTYDDLLDPQWKGRMIWHAGSSSGGDLFVTNLRAAWGEDRATAYLKKLSAQRIVNMAGGSARMLVDRVMAGEMAIALNIFAHHPLISRAKGAPVSSQLMDPVASTVGTMVIPKGLKHPHAALLLADFILSAEGQKILSGAEYFPVRDDVAPLPALAPILDAVAKSHENFVSPETLVGYTPRSEEIIRDLFR
jgi:iron(III) transport system substrate-binding protein